jgi:hypothetical protein
MGEMGRTFDNELILFTDEGALPLNHANLLALARKVFPNTTDQFIPKTSAKWPGSNNWVFAFIARHMARMAEPRPWLLLETDVVPVVPDWLPRLEEEYTKAAQPFMGAWVEYYDIMNGAAVYPPDVLSWSPDFFASDVTKAIAYDCFIAPDIMWFVHNATHMMPHIWFSRANSRPGGLVPKIPDWTPRMAAWVLTHNAVLAHRCKDGKLIEYLRSRAQ